MFFKSISSAVCLCMAAFTFNASAAIVNADWLTTGDNLITRDTTNNLEWLDLTQTANLSYSYVSSQLGVGGVFEGWHYAATAEVSLFFDAFGGNGVYMGYSTDNNGLFDALAPYWGDLDHEFRPSTFPNPGDGYSYFITTEAAFPSEYYRNVGLISDDVRDPSMDTGDYVKLSQFSWTTDAYSPYGGSALVRDITVVPTPTTVWLFGSGLLCLMGVFRYNKA